MKYADVTSRHLLLQRLREHMTDDLLAVQISLSKVATAAGVAEAVLWRFLQGEHKRSPRAEFFDKLLTLRLWGQETRALLRASRDFETRLT